MSRGGTPPLPTSVGGTSVYIPPFNPNTSGRSVQDWLLIVRNVRSIWKWSETETVQLAGSVLGGDASKWFTVWLTPNPSLDDFTSDDAKT